MKRFDGDDYELERAIVTYFALVRAWREYGHGNLVFKDPARSFNPLAPMAGRICIAEVEELVERGDIDPNHAQFPDVYVHRVVALSAEQAEEGTSRNAPLGVGTWVNARERTLITWREAIVSTAEETP